ncbi:peptidoglycan bridge formation glycyltransferase FemA/FemB family protein, partial [bacterium]|nr:peptidoglycan bridge formation glycyltransferase FemA/FemB family protein [bacterium]
PLGMTYLYCPRGPVIRENLSPELKEQILKIILKGIRDICIQTSKRKEIFSRFEPHFNMSSLENCQKVKDLQPAHTLLLDLNKSEDQLLTEMHQKTRYNVKLARRKGVLIEKVDNYLEAIDIFEKLMNKTSARDKFISHSKKYYEKILKTMPKNASLWLAKYNNVVLSANLVINFGDTVTYLHGASSSENRNVMAPHLLQWEQIKWAQNNGFQIYDFWGIAKSDDVNDKWAGFTRFKKGFGGFKKEYSGTFDLVYDQRIYKLYKLVRKLKVSS